MKKYIYGLISFFLLVFVDQATKWLAIDRLKGKTPFTIWSKVFELQYVENRGAAFGIFHGKRILLLIIGIIVFIAIVYVFSKIPSSKQYFPLNLCCVLLLSGAVGNMIDRIMNGYVVDFFYFKLINFPVFNVADCYVVIAAILCLYLVLFYYHESDFDFIKQKI